jgi:hypothetical protein
MQDKMDDSCGGRTQRGDEPISSWLGIEEVVSPLTGKKDGKQQAPASGGRRWSSVVSATVVVLIMTTPALLFLLSGRLGAPVVWIRSTVASVGTQRQTGNHHSAQALHLIRTAVCTHKFEISVRLRFKIYHYRTYHIGRVLPCSFRFKITVLNYHEKKTQAGPFEYFLGPI